MTNHKYQSGKAAKLNPSNDADRYYRKMVAKQTLYKAIGIILGLAISAAFILGIALIIKRVL